MDNEIHEVIVFVGLNISIDLIMIRVLNSHLTCSISKLLLWLYILNYARNCKIYSALAFLRERER